MPLPLRRPGPGRLPAGKTGNGTARRPRRQHGTSPRRCPRRRGGRCATPSPGSPLTSSQARTGSPPSCARGSWNTRGTPPPSPSTSGTPTPSRPLSAARSPFATSTARGPAATGPPPSATCTTWSTRKTAARHLSAIVLFYASFTMTCASTAGDGGLTPPPDGTWTATSPDGGKILTSHGPPGRPGTDPPPQARAA